MITSCLDKFTHEGEIVVANKGIHRNFSTIGKTVKEYAVIFRVALVPTVHRVSHTSNGGIPSEDLSFCYFEHINLQKFGYSFSIKSVG